MSVASSSSLCNPEKRYKHAISFLLNPERRTRNTDCGATTTPVTADESRHDHEEVSSISVDQETLNIGMSEDDETNPVSPFEMTSSATRVCSTLSGSGGITHPCVQMGGGANFVGVTADSPNHEGYIDEETADGTKHISLDNGELVTNSPRRTSRRGRPKKRKRRLPRTNLQQKRLSMASRAHTTSFSRRDCCKKLRCFQNVDESVLRDFVKETMLMCQPDRKARLRSWLVDGEFIFCRKRVCSAFLAGAFGFSRDLQRAVKSERERVRGGRLIVYP